MQIHPSTIYTTTRLLHFSRSCSLSDKLFSYPSHKAIICVYIKSHFTFQPCSHVCLPSHADPCFHYTTNVVAIRLKLSMWTEPFMVALADLLIDLPFDIMGIKLIWWTWHDSDPNIFDRTYSVPWTRYCI